MLTDRYQETSKSVVDLTLALVVLIILAPLMAIVALLIRIKLGSPILFRQQRPGLHGQPFSLFKFRTMTNARDAEGHLLPDVERLTILGRFLRRTSLDELPAVINVLRREMSIVGPRPLLIRYLDRYTPEQARRHEVLPGITGLAQVNGRNTMSWGEKFSLDVYYVDNQSLWLDLKIIVWTISAVFSGSGVIEEGDLSDFWGAAGPPSDDRLVYPAEQDETYLLRHQ